jgi:hypothetical protein
VVDGPGHKGSTAETPLCFACSLHKGKRLAVSGGGDDKDKKKKKTPTSLSTKRAAVYRRGQSLHRERERKEGPKSLMAALFLLRANTGNKRTPVDGK